MPPDGSTASAARLASREERRGVRRSRFRRFMFVAHAVTALSHGVPTVALLLVLPPLWAMGAGAALFVLTALRLRAAAREGRRPRWVTLLFDEPLLAHWCASVLSTVVFPVAVVIALTVRSFGGVDIGWPRAVVWAAFGSYGFAALVSAWGVGIRRRWVRITHVDVPIADLPPALDGYRIAQLSDLHIGNYDGKERGLVWARRANQLGPDLVVVTGDLVTTGTTFYEDVAEVIGALRGKDGVFVSMGNHDQWDPDALSGLIEAHGPVVLRNRSAIVRRGSAELVVAGIDDRMTGKDDLDLTLAARPARAPTVLLSHYPDFFEAAAERGVDLVLSGHTHGGQVGVPFASRRFSLSGLLGQAVPGLHVRGRSRLFVNTGLGTTGPPVRLGVPPEIAVLVLRRT